MRLFNPILNSVLENDGVALAVGELRLLESTMVGVEVDPGSYLHLEEPELLRPGQDALSLLVVGGGFGVDGRDKVLCSRRRRASSRRPSLE